MKLKNLIKFRHMRVQKLTRLQIVSRVCALGAVVCFVAAVCSYVYLEQDYSDNLKKGELSFPFSQHISIQTENIPLYIYPSDDDMIKIRYVSDSEISVYEEKGRLFIEQQGDFVITMFSFSQYDLRLEVWLPQESYRSLNIATSTASVYSCALSGHMIELTSKSGYMSVQDISSTGKVIMDFSDGNADINISRFSGGELSNINGTINVAFAGEADIEVLHGSRCYVNGIAVTGGEGGAGDKALKLYSESGRVRITTGQTLQASDKD